MGTLANSEDPDEMQHNAAFNRGLHCLLRLKQPSVVEMHHNSEKFYRLPLKVHNGQSHTICLNLYEKIHQKSKGKEKTVLRQLN